MRAKFGTFNDKEIQFLRDVYKSNTRKEMGDLFNKNFVDNQKNDNQIKVAIVKYQIKSGRTGRFTKDQKPWNKGVTGYMGANKTSFKKGRPSINERPIGSERICSKDGYILVKVKLDNGQQKFKLKHRVIWEAAHGEIPKGHAIKFKDGNKLNVTLDNLMLISRGALAILNRQHRLNDTPVEAQESVILMASIKSKIIDLKKSQ